MSDLHVLSLSGGLSSAVAAYRALQKHPDTVLWFADTSFEDEDLYRFLDDLEKYFNKTIVRYKDGRNPLEVNKNKNLGLWKCPQILKITPFSKYLKSQLKLYDHIYVYLGLDWLEAHRMTTPKQAYEYLGRGKITVDYPLMWKPYINTEYYKVVNSWGIATPRLYEMGFTHNNCGGRCVKQGKQQWQMLLKNFPNRFEQMANYERIMGGTYLRKQVNYIRSNYSLDEVSKEPIPASEGIEDRFSCFCSL